MVSLMCIALLISVYNFVTNGPSELEGKSILINSARTVTL